MLHETIRCATRASLALLAVCLAAALAPNAARAQDAAAPAPQEAPRVATSTCPVLADVAMKSAVFADEKIPRKQAERLLQRLYRWDGEGVDLLAAMVLDRAYASPLMRGTAEKFASRILQVCMLRGGDLEAVFGRGT